MQLIFESGRTVEMETPELIECLCLRNRAYNLLYALGETPATVRTLEPGEESFLVSCAKRVEAGKVESQLEQEIASKVPPAQLHYVATGRI